jgi:2,4-dienoyl-CoA reductase-like NADH-dependent reductase (Old Yellow Enzyme family)
MIIAKRSAAVRDGAGRNGEDHAMALTRVYEPLTINGVEIPNRIGRSAHGTGLSRGAPLSDALIDYHLARAKGGVGLTILEAAAPHPTSVISLNATDDRLVPGYRKLMAAVRPYGMRVFQQIFHGGNLMPQSGDRYQPPWGVSALPHPANGHVPHPMDKGQIEELVGCFAAAAGRCREGGLDGVEVHAGHGYLLAQFLSPLTNRRTDEYGGPLENRMRFLKEIMVASRKAVGDDYPLGIRCSASDVPGAVTEEDLVAIAQALKAEGLLDFISVSWSDYFRNHIVSAMDKPAGYQLASSAKVTGPLAGTPRMVIGRIRTLEEAEGILREGIADLVHMNRAHIADPDIVRKTRAGHPEQVRPCIACDQGCWAGLAQGYPMACTVNPATGFEATLSEDLIRPAPAPRKVLVVGGGPAGMEAARVAALAGHRVVLAEAGARLGGQVAVARRAPALHTIGDIETWLEQEVFRLGVEVRLGSYFDADEVLAEQADHVVLATGALPPDDGLQALHPQAPIPGFDRPHVLSAVELLANPPKALGGSALVFDDVGHYEGLAAAEFLLSRGVEVAFATKFGAPAPNVDATYRVEPALERFARLGGFSLLTNAKLERIGERDCAVRSLYRREPVTVAADHVVLVLTKRPCRELYDALRACGLELGRDLSLVGDALAPRDLQMAISTGHRAVRSWSSQASAQRRETSG